MADAGNALLQSWEFEHGLSGKSIRAVPPAKIAMRPHEKSRSMQDLCWHIAEAERYFVVQGLGLDVPGENPVQKDAPLATPEAIAGAFDRSHGILAAAVAKQSPGWFAESVDFHGSKVPRAGLLDVMLRHEAHHRGQLSVYLRLAGGKCPSIYGGSADEKA